MSPQNQMVNRLQAQKSRIAAMLSPGSRKLRANQDAWSLSPVTSQFGGRKFRLAAQKMRVLHKDHLGLSSFGSSVEMANTLQAKFRSPRSLLHVTPVGARGKSFWSEVEQVFPALGGAETPPEPGELRRGSLIQRFETVPQPGQSLESFKEQIQDKPVVRKPDGVKSEVISQPKKPNLVPRGRLSARIQELTAAQRQQEQVTPSKPRAEQTPEAPESGQPEAPPAVPAQKPPADRLELPAAHAIKKTEKPATSKTPLPQATPTARALPLEGKLLRARPSLPPSPATSMEQVLQRQQVETGKPVQKVERQPSVQPPEARLAVPPSAKAPDSAAIISTPQEHVPAEPEHSKSLTVSVPQPQAPAKSEQKDSQPEMPLKQHLQRRSAVIERLVPAASRPGPAVRSRKMLKLKTSPIARTAIVLGEGTSLAMPSSSPIEPVPVQRKSSGFPLHQVATAWKTARKSWRSAKTIVSKTIDTITAPISAPETSIHESVDKVIGTATSPFETARAKMKEMFGDEEEKKSSPAPQAEAQRAAKAQGSPEQLAEQILPLVKRLLEIESERTGRQFHS